MKFTSCLFFFFLTISSISTTFAESTSLRGTYCSKMTYDCSPAKRVYFTNLGINTSSDERQYMCAAPFQITCTKISKDDSSIDGEDDADWSCFPPSASVQSADNRSITMRDLRIGDQILDGHENPVTVLGWMHRDPMRKFKTVTINNRLSVSLKHLLSTPEGYVFAGSLGIGDTIRTGRTATNVTSLEYKTSLGIYAPYTTSGTILVDGVSASCYAVLPYHHLANIVMWAQYKLGLMVTEDIDVLTGFGYSLVSFL